MIAILDLLNIVMLESRSRQQWKCSRGGYENQPTMTKTCLVQKLQTDERPWSIESS